MSEIQLPEKTSGTARVQGELWSQRAADWAEHEASSWALYDHALHAAHVAPGKRLLDIGCGSGFAVARAVARGAIASGLDAAPALIEIARRRAPAAELHVGEMEEMPFADGTFDVVTGFNAFQYAGSPVRALREARRVTRPGGLLAAVTWGPAAACQAAVFREALALLRRPDRDSSGPCDLAEMPRLSAMVAEAGWSPLAISDVAVEWHWRDLESALRALLSSGSAVHAMRQAGMQRTREVAIEVLRRFEAAEGYRMHNKFRCLVARR